ncbi:hypothetical protein [Arthrobacter sp.]|uniref:hypothetical protein n=1 Tax=Arthrobacter sp. TaxID=1667 RepID=UPI003A9133B8
MSDLVGWLQVILAVLGVAVAAFIALRVSAKEFERNVTHQARLDGARLLDAAWRLSGLLDRLQGLEANDDQSPSGYRVLNKKELFRYRREVLDLISECRHRNELLQMTAPLEIREVAQSLFEECRFSGERFERFFEIREQGTVYYLGGPARCPRENLRTLVTTIEEHISAVRQVCTRDDTPQRTSLEAGRIRGLLQALETYGRRNL